MKSYSNNENNENNNVCNVIVMCENNGENMCV